MSTEFERIRTGTVWYPNGGRLVVTIPNFGLIIRYSTATKTFIETLILLDLRKVERIGLKSSKIDLISRTKHPNKQQHKHEQFYIETGSAPEGLKLILDKVATQLGITVITELFTK